MISVRGGFTACLLVLLSAGAFAQDTGVGGRYALVPTADGLIRLDTETGEVSRCTGDVAALACRLLPDERMAYEREIARLEDRIVTLEGRMEDLEAGGGRPFGMDMPDEKDLDEALTLAEQMMRRFFDMVRGLKEDMETDQL